MRWLKLWWFREASDCKNEWTWGKSYLQTDNRSSLLDVFFVKSWIYFGAQASCLRFCSHQCHHCTVFIIIITINSDRSSWRYDGRYDQCNATHEMHLIHTIKTNKQTMQLLFPENITSDDDNNATSMKSISNHVSAANCVRHFIGCALIECNKCNGEVNIKTLSCFSWLLTWLDSHNKQTKKQRDDVQLLFLENK